MDSDGPLAIYAHCTLKSIFMRDKSHHFFFPFHFRVKHLKFRSAVRYSLHFTVPMIIIFNFNVLMWNENGSTNGRSECCPFQYSIRFLFMCHSRIFRWRFHSPAACSQKGANVLPTGSRFNYTRKAELSAFALQTIARWRAQYVFPLYTRLFGGAHIHRIKSFILISNSPRWIENANVCWLFHKAFLWRRFFSHFILMKSHWNPESPVHIVWCARNPLGDQFASFFFTFRFVGFN